MMQAETKRPGNNKPHEGKWTVKHLHCYGRKKDQNDYRRTRNCEDTRRINRLGKPARAALGANSETGILLRYIPR